MPDDAAPPSTWTWTTQQGYAGTARLERPIACGTLHVVDDGVAIEPEDDFYTGLLPPAAAVRLARVILAKWGDSYPENLNP